MFKLSVIFEKMGIKQMDEKRARLLVGIGLLGMVLIGISAAWPREAVNPVSTTGSPSAQGSYGTTLDPGDGDSTGVAKSGDLDTVSRYAREMEVRAQRILSRIDGAGRVWVTISMEQGSIAEYATNNTTEQKTTTEKDSGGTVKSTTESTTTEQVVAMNGGGAGDSPVLVKRMVPSIAGVLVVSEGAVDAGVKLELTQAVATLFGIPEHKILVAGSTDR